MLRAWLVAFCCEVVVAAVRMGGGRILNPGAVPLTLIYSGFFFAPRHCVCGVLPLLLLYWGGGGGGPAAL